MLRLFRGTSNCAFDRFYFIRNIKIQTSINRLNIFVHVRLMYSDGPAWRTTAPYGFAAAARARRTKTRYARYTNEATRGIYYIYFYRKTRERRVRPASLPTAGIRLKRYMSP